MRGCPTPGHYEFGGSAANSVGQLSSAETTRDAGRSNQVTVRAQAPGSSAAMRGGVDVVFTGLRRSDDRILGDLGTPMRGPVRR